MENHGKQVRSGIFIWLFGIWGPKKRVFFFNSPGSQAMPWPVRHHASRTGWMTQHHSATDDCRVTMILFGDCQYNNNNYYYYHNYNNYNNYNN